MIRNLVLTIGVALATGTAGPTRASDSTDPPTTQPADRAQPRFLQIDELSLDLSFESEWQRRTVRTDARGLGGRRFDQKNRDLRFGQSIGLQSRGSILGPRVLRYDLSLRAGLAQERFTEIVPGRDTTQTPHGDLFEYDLRLQAFPAGRVSVSGFASKLDDRLPRPFLPSLQRRRERFGVELTYSDARLPMSLLYEHLFDDITSRSRGLIDDEERAEDRLRYEATWQPTEYHSLHLEYEYERRSERFSGTRTRFDTTRSILSVDHSLAFGEDHRSRLDTLLRIEDEDGDLARDAFEFAPHLRLRHTDALSSNYRIQFLDERYFDLQTSTLRGDAGVSYNWKDMLTASLEIYGLHQKNDENADIDEWGGLANLSFSRKNRLGRFSADLNYLHSETRSADGRRDALVFNEAVTFRGPLPSYLAHSNVHQLTLLVTDATRTRVYLRGPDYRVVPRGDVTALVRVATGAIVDRQTVSVSYAYAAFDDYELTRDRLDLRVRQRFGDDLDAYYAMAWQNETLDHGRFLRFRERDVKRHRAGLTYRRPRWSAGLEIEFNDDSVDPFVAGHVNGDVILIENARHTLEGHSSASVFRFEGHDFLNERGTTLVDAGLNYRYLFGRNLEASASADYRFEDDSIFGATQGVDLTASLAYRIGLFSVLVEAEYDALDLPGSTDNTAAVWLKLRRDIPVIGDRVRRW